MQKKSLALRYSKDKKNVYFHKKFKNNIGFFNIFLGFIISSLRINHYQSI